uniref:Capsid protein n=1 Tax=Riboviria sp. TaxID=2585031 RepID=A0A6M9Z7J8_9VIRU|nr:MAG: hypothetical protein 2 [Riboviria sp.]
MSNRNATRGIMPKKASINNKRKTMQGRVPLPPNPRASPQNLLGRDDAITLRVSGVFEVTNATEGGTSHIFALKPKSINTPSYTGLADVSPLVGNIASNYTKFMVSNLRIGVQGVSSALTGGFAMANYEPTDSSLAGPPSSVRDVTNSAHSITVAPGMPMKYFTANPASYFQDWRSCVSEGDLEGAEQECGVVQVYGKNPDGEDSVTVLISLEYDIHFAGFRSS